MKIKNYILWLFLLFPLWVGLACNLPMFQAAQETAAPTSVPEMPTAPVFPPASTPTPAPTSPPEPTPTPEETPPPTPAPVEVLIEGVRFVLYPELAGGTDAQIIPGQPPYSDGPPWSSAPEHLSIQFTDYALQNHLHSPTLLVYPLQAYKRFNSAAGLMIARARTAINSGVLADSDLPLLPLFNAGQILQTHVALVGFQNGQGYRFVTQYGQDAGQINNHALFYSFQGITADGNFYIAAVFPITARILPPDAFSTDLPIGGVPFPGYGHPNFSKAYADYLKEVHLNLEALGPDDFYPTLNQLDNLVRSIAVDGITWIDPGCVTMLTAAGGIPARAYVNTEQATSNRLRTGPSQDDLVLAAIPPGTEMELLEGPICDGGVVFWEVRVVSTGDVGYTAESDGDEQWLLPCLSADRCP